MSGSAPTASMTVSAGQAGVVPIAFGLYPREGSRAIATQYDWTSLTSYTVILSQTVARGMETTIQSVYFDNNTVSQYVTLYIPASGQVVSLPPRYQGVMPLFFSGMPAFVLSIPNAEASVTRLLLLNVPAQSVGVWPA